MKKLKYIKLFENLVSYGDGTDMKELDTLFKSGMLNGEDLIRMLQDTGMMTKENTALIQIQGMSRSGFGKLTYGARIVLNQEENLINDNAQEQISGSTIIRLAKAEAVAMGARFAFRNLNWFLKFYDLQNGTDYTLEDRNVLQLMTDFMGINRLDSDDPHLDEEHKEDLETSDEYIALNKAGLVPSAIAVRVNTGYFADDEELDYDQVGEDYSEEIKNWMGPAGLKVLKGSIELNADGDNYYTFGGSFTYEVMMSDRTVLHIKTMIQRSSEVVEEYYVIKDNEKIDLKDTYLEFEEEGTYTDPIHDDNGDLIITQPLDFMVQYSGLYSTNN